MKTIFKTYETLSGKFEYLMSTTKGCKGTPKGFKSETQAINASAKIETPTKVIRSISGKIFFLVKDSVQIEYLKELENRFGGVEHFMNAINRN